MAAIYFIWIIRIRMRLNRKRYPNQSKSKNNPKIRPGLDSKNWILYITALNPLDWRSLLLRLDA